MKKYAFIFLSSLFFYKTGTAQESQLYKPFKWDIGLGMTSQSPGSKGVLLYMEPSYLFASRFKAGLRFEEAFLNMKNIGSSLLTFDYYFTGNRRFRVFAGAGYGYYYPNTMGGCDPGSYVTKTSSETNKTGAMVRTGLEFGHLRLGIEYSFVPSTYVTSVSNTDLGYSTVIYKNGYFGFKIALSIGGGKKKKLPGAK